MGDYRKLAVWEKAHQMVLATYRVTRNFPKDELYGLMSQMRRAATSIPSNLAEGSGKGTDAELVRYARISMGSARELEYQYLLVRDLEYISPDDFNSLDAQIKEVLRMLTGLIHNLDSRK